MPRRDRPRPHHDRRATRQGHRPRPGARPTRSGAGRPTRRARSPPPGLGRGADSGRRSAGHPGRTARSPCRDRRRSWSVPCRPARRRGPRLSTRTSPCPRPTFGGGPHNQRVRPRTRDRGGRHPLGRRRPQRTVDHLLVDAAHVHTYSGAAMARAVSVSFRRWNVSIITASSSVRSASIARSRLPG